MREVPWPTSAAATGIVYRLSQIEKNTRLVQ